MKQIILLPFILLVFCCEEIKEDETVPQYIDCEGVEGGQARLDSCGICDADISNDCSQDCAGEWGGTAVFDECDVCNGDDSSCQLSFRLTDRNPESSTWSQLVGPETFRGKVTAYYFPYSET